MGEFERLARQFGWRIEDHGRPDGGVWHLAGGGTVHYPESAHELCAAAEEHSYWFQHRNRVLLRLLRQADRTRAFWDIGCGNGWVARALQQAGFEVVGVEPHASAAATAARRGVDAVICGRLEDLQLPAGALGSLGCFDVIEHMEDPVPFLAEARRVLADHGTLAVSVPALPRLWSRTDEASGHFRRYTRAGLAADLRRAGFAPRRVEYLFMALVPPVFFCRTLPRGGRRERQAGLDRCGQELVPSSRMADRLMRLALAAEFAIGRRLPLPCGTSLAGWFEKT